MKIVSIGTDDGAREVLEHEWTSDVVDAAQGHPGLVAFVVRVIRDFYDHESLSHRTPNLRKMANDYAKQRAHRNQADRICTGIEKLYSTFEPSAVRGALLEAMVQRSLQSRYAGPRDLLENNLAFRVEKGDRSHETSTSVDVVGLDVAKSEGECHDCKVKSKSFDCAWLRELTDLVAPFGFRIGIATADSEQRARRSLEQLGFQVGGAAVLVTPDTWDLLPLRL